MSDLWTIIFFTLCAIGFGIAAWHDREKAKRRERKEAVYEKNRSED
jgi:hypothetical protein